MANKGMKVAFLNITQNLVNRGAETFVAELSSQLEADCQVEIISGHSLPPKRWPLFWRFFIDPQGLSILGFTLGQVGRIWKGKYDVVVPLNGGWQSVVVRLVTWLYGGKMVVAGQSGKGWDDRINLLTNPDCFVALSTAMKKWAKSFSPWVRVEYIPNGVNLAKFHLGGVSINTVLARPIILCVGALTAEKRINLAIQAVAKLKKGSLLVVGEGPLASQLREQGNRLLGKRFVLTTYDFAKMPQVYRMADLFTLPSPGYRSFEIVIVEALASNVPVVVNDDPIRREIVGEAGLFVEPTDLEKYTSVLEEALKIKWRDKPLKQAKKFSWKIVGERYLDLFRELVR